MQKGIKRLMGFLIIIFISLLTSCLTNTKMEIQKDVQEDIVVYKKPGDSVLESPYYSVNIEKDGVKKPSFVYLSEPPIHDDADPKTGTKSDGAEHYRDNGITQNWTTFSLSGKAMVEVEKLDGQTFNTVRILPTRYGMEPIISSDKKSVQFEIEPAQKVMVEFDQELKHRLYIFADPIELHERVPDKSDVSVFVVGSGGPQFGEEPGCLDGLNGSHKILYFPKGEYSIEQYGTFIEVSKKIEDRVGSRSAWTVPTNIEQIYIEGGAIVYGGFYIIRDDVMLNGRGIISGKPLLYHQMNMVEFQAGTKGGYVEGITIADGVHFSLRAWNAHYDGENFKVIANWRFNNDGINVPENAHIKNCYISGNDDTVKLYFSGSTLENCVIGQMINGAVFQFGWGYRDVSNITVKNIDILHMDGKNANPNLGVINFRPRGKPDEVRDYCIQNIVFDGINVDNPAIRFISLALPKHQIFKDVTIRNVNIKSWTNLGIKNYIKASTIADAPGAGLANHFVFDNVRVGDNFLTADNLEKVGNFEPFDSNIVSNFEYIYPDNR